jgi:predicted transcriptional regulator
MSQIAVPEKFSAELHDLAAHDHRAVEEVVDEAINSYLASRFHEPQLTSPEIARLREGIAQLDRGERIASEDVDRKFENWRKRRASR